MAEVYCTRCSDIGRRVLAVGVPVVVLPIVNWPGAPAYMQFKGGLCRAHICAFTLATYTDWCGDWYEQMSDQVRAVRKPATNPYPNDPSFKWEEFIINPNFEPVAKEQCVLQFWKVEVLAAKGASYSMGGARS